MLSLVALTSIEVVHSPTLRYNVAQQVDTVSKLKGKNILRKIYFYNFSFFLSLK